MQVTIHVLVQIGPYHDSSVLDSGTNDINPHAVLQQALSRNKRSYKQETRPVQVRDILSGGPS